MDLGRRTLKLFLRQLIRWARGSNWFCFVCHSQSRHQFQSESEAESESQGPLLGTWNLAKPVLWPPLPVACCLVVACCSAAPTKKGILVSKHTHTHTPTWHDEALFIQFLCVFTFAQSFRPRHHLLIALLHFCFIYTLLLFISFYFSVPDLLSWLAYSFDVA